MANSLGTLSLFQSNKAFSAERDFKALVYIFLEGGNDAFNMLVPKEAGQLKQNQNQGTRQVLIETIAQANDNQRFDLAIYGIATLPELLIQK